MSSPVDLTISMTLTVVIDGVGRSLLVSSSKSINGWVSAGGVPGVGLDVWVVVTVLIVLGRVVAEVDGVLSELHGGGGGGKGGDHEELHI